MTRQELRVFLGKWFCGCGSPTDATMMLRDLLALHPLYSHRDELKALMPNDGTEMLLLYTLDYFNLTEHGGTVCGAWLTDFGTSVLAALNAESSDNFEALFAGHCAHGYDIHDESHHCFAEDGKEWVEP